MKILLTGAAGYLGHRLALHAAGNGYRVHALVANPQAANLPQHANIRFFKGDVTQPQAIAGALAGCDFVIHAVAPDRHLVNGEKDVCRVHLGGSVNVLEASLRAGVKRVVFSTTAAHNQPLPGLSWNSAATFPERVSNDETLLQYCASRLVKEYTALGLPMVTVSWPEIYGPGMHPSASPVTAVIRQAIDRGFAFIPADTSRLSSYTFIEDVAHGHLLALERGKIGAQYFLGGQNTSYEELFDTLRTISARDIRLLSVPRVLLLTWRAIFPAFARLLGMGSGLSAAPVRSKDAGSEKACTELGYSITPLYTGIEKTLQYYKTGN